MPKNLYRRGSIWWGRIEVAGRDHRRSLRTADRQEAGRRLKAWRSALIDQDFGIEQHTWQEAVLGWHQDAAKGLKPATLKRYLCSITMVDPILAGLRIEQIDRRVLARIAGRPGPGNATRRRDLSAVSAVLRWAVVQEWIVTNPARDFDRGIIRERREPIRLPTDEDVAALLAVTPGDMLRALVRLLLDTGLRLEEAAGLERRNVDFHRGVITLDRTKTSRPRAVPIPAQTAGTVQGLPAMLGCPFIFWHGEGRRYRNLSSRFQALMRRRDFRGERFRLHDLRHRFAIDAMKKGASIYDVQGWLGHGSIKTTELYLRYLTPEEQRVAMRVNG